MCESKIYIREGEHYELIIENVVSLTPKEGGFIVIDISGKRYELDNVSIDYIDFLNHKVILKKNK
ncbi:MAG: CooT family nickel-binding protein [Ignisphaera sp.]